MMMLLSVVYFTFVFRRSAGRGRASDRESTSPRRPLTSAHGPIGTGPERCPLLAESLWTVALLPPPPPTPWCLGGGVGILKILLTMQHLSCPDGQTSYCGRQVVFYLWIGGGRNSRRRITRSFSAACSPCNVFPPLSSFKLLLYDAVSIKM